MQTKTLSERIAIAINQISNAEMGRQGESDEGFFVFREHGKVKHFDIFLCKKELCNIIEELQQESKAWQEMVESTNQTNQALVKRLCEFGEEKDELLAKNKELEGELEERKAYIVANPCAQCGGRINAIKCEAWAKKAKELEEKVEIAKDYIDRALLKSREHRSENAVDILENALIKLNKQGE